MPMAHFRKHTYGKEPPPSNLSLATCTIQHVFKFIKGTVILIQFNKCLLAISDIRMSKIYARDSANYIHGHIAFPVTHKAQSVGVLDYWEKDLAR